MARKKRNRMDRSKPAFNSKISPLSALSSKVSPLNLQSTLVKGAGLTSYYSGGDASTTYGEIDMDKMFDPAKKVLADRMKKKEDKDKDDKDGKSRVGNITVNIGDIYPDGTKKDDGKKDDGKKDDGKEMCKCEGKTDLPADHEDCDPNCGETTETDCEKNPEGDDCPCKCEGSFNANAKFDPSILNGTYKNGECVCPGLDEYMMKNRQGTLMNECKEKGGTWKEDCGCCGVGDEPECCAEELPPSGQTETDCDPDTERWDGKKCVPIEEKKKITKKENIEQYKKDLEEKNQELDNLTLVQPPCPDGMSQKDCDKTYKNTIKNLKKKTTTKVNRVMLEGVNKKESWAKKNSSLLGGYSGNITTNFDFGRGGKVKGVNNVGDNYDISYKFTEDGVVFNPSISTRHTGLLRKNYDNYNQNGKYTQREWNAFIAEYNESLEGTYKKIYNYNNLLTDKENGMKALERKVRNHPDRHNPPYPKDLQELRQQIKDLKDLKKNGFTDKDIATLQLSGRKFQPIGITTSLEGYKEPSPLNHPAEDSQLKGYKKGLTHYHLKDKDGKIKREWAWRSDTDLADKYKHEDWFTPHPNSPKSPFTRRERGYLNVRKKWMPNQQPPQEMAMGQPGMEGVEGMGGMEGMEGMETPMGYRSPLRVEEVEMDAMQETSVSEGGETIWDKMMQYGDGISDQVDNFIGHIDYEPTYDKPITTIKNPEWVNVITEWLQNKKQEIINATKRKDNKLKQKLDGNVNTLIQDVTSYAGKFVDWVERNGGDETPGSKGGSTVSEGSKKDERFFANLTFMGDTNTDLGIDDDGRLGIKSYGLNDVKRVQDLDGGVFRRDDSGLATFLDIYGLIKDDAEANKPLNKNIVNGQADLLIKQLDSLLSWAHDPLYGQAWIQDYAQANPNEDYSWAMPESDQFDKDRLEDEVHGWLTDKLTQSYYKNRPKNDRTVEQIHNETMTSLESREEVKPELNTPGIRKPLKEGGGGSALTYKKQSLTAKELIAKYS